MRIGRAIYLGMTALVALAVTALYAADVPDDAITLKVGQLLYVTFTENGDTLEKPQIQQQPSTTDPFVTLQLKQDGPTRTLLITNGYAKPLSYRAIARMRGRRRQFELPGNPVRPGMQGIVTLSEPFDEMLLFEFRYANAQ